MNLLPVRIAFAQSAGKAAGSVDSLVNSLVVNIINPLVGILFAVAFALFIFGIGRFIWQSSDENARTQGKNHMLAGGLGMLIIISVYSIIRVIAAFVGSDLYIS